MVKLRLFGMNYFYLANTASKEIFNIKININHLEKAEAFDIILLAKVNLERNIYFRAVCCTDRNSKELQSKPS